jgi:hypothetical protein
VPDLTTYKVVPSSLHDTFFFNIVVSLAKEAFPSDIHSQLRQGLFQKMAVEQNIQWAEDFNQQMLSIYEELGAGTTIGPS